MDFKKTALGFGTRILRIAGIILVIYVSMVFYLALTERRNAFPRAITHVEANKAIEGKAKAISCTTEDGAVLGGWALGDSTQNTLLYYPDADEDAAQFLAEVEKIEGTSIITFNYRGSADNKGTPSQETFEPDARAILECASAWGGAPAFIAGRGTGAILAANQARNGQKAILIDPVISIADAISEKYGLLYPKFLVRADVEISRENLSRISPKPTLLLDREKYRDRNHSFFNNLTNLDSLERGEKSLMRTLSILTDKQTNDSTSLIK